MSRSLRLEVAVYGRHLGRDLGRRAGPRHLAADLGRFLARLGRTERAGDPPPYAVAGYAGLLHSLQEDARCRFQPLDDFVLRGPADPRRINVVLRHDVDGGDFAGVAALCEAEAGLGLTSAVHVLVDGSLYDHAGFVPEARRLHDRGFDIGLHTQAWMRTDYRAALLEEVRCFTESFGFEPRTFSLHGAWPRTDADLERRRELVNRAPEVLQGTPFGGYRDFFEWVSEDSNVAGRPLPLPDDFFRLADRAYLGGAALVLTHDVHWRAAEPVPGAGR